MGSVDRETHRIGELAASSPKGSDEPRTEPYERRARRVETRGSQQAMRLETELKSAPRVDACRDPGEREDAIPLRTALEKVRERVTAQRAFPGAGELRPESAQHVELRREESAGGQMPPQVPLFERVGREEGVERRVEPRAIPRADDDDARAGAANRSRIVEPDLLDRARHVDRLGSGDRELFAPEHPEQLVDHAHERLRITHGLVSPPGSVRSRANAPSCRGVRLRRGSTRWPRRGRRRACR